MKKLTDRIDRELAFYEGDEAKARAYFEVEGDTLEEIADAANAKEDSDFNNRYSVEGE